VVAAVWVSPIAALPCIAGVPVLMVGTRWYLKRETAEEHQAVGLPGSPVAEDPYRLELRDFLRAITHGGTARVEARDGLAALRIALAADESARSGRVVELSGRSA